VYDIYEAKNLFVMSKKHKSHSKNNQSFLHPVLFRFFAIAAFFLVPWSIVLWQSLPYDHLANHWNLAWSGFDFGLIVSLGLTAFLGLRKSGWVIIPASSAGILLLIDAWFDCLTAKQGGEYIVSLTTAAYIEIPMAALAFWIAYSAGKHYIKKK
jgi:hypothetical protein